MRAAYRVYVLQNRDARFYIGISDELSMLAERLELSGSGCCRFKYGLATTHVR